MCFTVWADDERICYITELSHSTSGECIFLVQTKDFTNLGILITKPTMLNPNKAKKNQIFDARQKWVNGNKMMFYTGCPIKTAARKKYLAIDPPPARGRRFS